MNADTLWSLRGLPPPARGALQHLTDGLHARGSTPACAGSTHRQFFPAHRRQVYPRLRGEHQRTGAMEHLATGLPPPARGAPFLRLYLCRVHRSTPACAGSTWATESSQSLRQVYPRLRGEHLALCATVAGAAGLPPPARGARSPRHLQRHRSGSTPACAGSTLLARTRCPPVRVYPRLRGEHPARGGDAMTRAGLPPPARGALLFHPHHRIQRGSTPACAGSTSYRPPCAHARGVYPRLRGEHEATEPDGEWVKGLPPPARGARLRRRVVRRRVGSTPACAGSTGGAALNLKVVQVYPRLRGEHSSAK